MCLGSGIGDPIKTGVFHVISNGGKMILKKSVLSFILALQFSLSVFAFNLQEPAPGEVTSDTQLIQAMRSQRRLSYVQAGNLTASKILPDDTQGLPHQKWEAKLSNGSKITIIYNLDMGKRVPIEVGKKFAVGGEFIWTKYGGLVHWTHFDDSNRRPDGYVYYEGEVYGSESDSESVGASR